MYLMTLLRLHTNIIVQRSIVFITLLISLSAAGCSGKEGGIKESDEITETAVTTLYDRAHNHMIENDWNTAISLFKRLVAQYPYGIYTEQALMETAYAQFKSANNDEAISTIDRFLRTYPSNSNIPYMYYLRGLVNSTSDTIFLKRIWSLDAGRRDLARPMQAFNDFRIIVEHYPESRYALEARKDMIALRNLFARHELLVGLYQLRQGAYVASANRAKYVLESYPKSQYQNDAIALLGVSYTHLGDTVLANDARRVLEKNDPSHPWLHGDWPEFPSKYHRMNPFSGEKSMLDQL